MIYTLTIEFNKTVYVNDPHKSRKLRFAMAIYIICLSTSHYRCQQPHSENVVVLKSPKPPLVLGAPPRLAYPLVVFMIREMESDELLHPDETVGS